VPAAASHSELIARRDVGVAWMNRGHAQLLLNNPTGDAAALNAYEHAIALLRTLPLAENHSWANSLGAACMNHGQLLHRIYGTARADEALASFDLAAAALRDISTDESPWPRRNLAGTQLNRANLLLDLGRPADAAAAAREALTFCLAAERTDLIEADLALKARRALGDALGQLLVAPDADQQAIANEASNVVDDALGVIRSWQSRGQSGFAPLAVRFFRYGTQLYRFHQPHFLAEFIQENIALSPECRVIAREAVDAALADRPRGFLTIGDPATERHLQIQRELETLRSLFSA
jgi:tetratricopeptide (TPR) repeat protein